MKMKILRQRCHNAVSKKDVVDVFLKFNEEYKDADRSDKKLVKEDLFYHLEEDLIDFVESCCSDLFVNVKEEISWVEESEETRALFGIIGGHLPKSRRTLYYPKPAQIALGIQRFLTSLGYKSYKIGDDVLMTKYKIERI